MRNSAYRRPCRPLMKQHHNRDYADDMGVLLIFYLLLAWWAIEAGYHIMIGRVR